MGVFINKSFKQSTVNVPDHDASPEVKQGPEWCLDAAKYIYGLYIGDKTAIKSGDITRILRTRSYADGRQDTEIYKNRILNEDQNPTSPPLPVVDNEDRHITTLNSGAHEGWVNVNFEDIFSPAPKLMNNIMGIMDKQHHTSVVDCIDPVSVGIKEGLKYISLINKEHGEWIKMFSQVVGIPDSPNSVINQLPMSLEEIELFRNIGTLKLSYEIGLARALEHTANISNESDIQRKVIYDLLTAGVACVIDDVIPGSQVVKKKYIDITDCIIEYSKNFDFDNSSFGAYCIMMSLYDVKKETGLPDSELLTFVSAFGNVLGNSGTINTSWTDAQNVASNYTLNIPVMVGFIKTIDKTYDVSQTEVPITSKVRKAEIESGKVLKRDDGSYYKIVDISNLKDSIDTVYKFKWIIGTDSVWNNGRLNDVAFDFKDRQSLLPMHIVGIPGKPMFEGAIPIFDEIFIAFLKFQNAVATAAPPGISIEVGTLENITYDGKPMKTKDVINFYSQTGNLLYRLQAPGTVGGGQTWSIPDPIKELKGGLGTIVLDTAQTFELLYGQLMEVTGIDRISSVSEGVKKGQLVGVAEIAQAGTSNTLQTTYQKRIGLLKRSDKSVALRIVGICLNSPEENYYKDVIGEGAFLSLVSMGPVPPIQLGVNIEPKPSDEQKIEIKQAAREALAGGKNGIPALTYGEYLFIVSMIDSNAGIEYARAYIMYKEGKKREAEAKLAKENVAFQSEKQTEFEQKKNIAEAEKDNILTTNKIKVINAQGEVDIKVDAAKENLIFEHQKELIPLQAATKESNSNTNKN